MEGENNLPLFNIILDFELIFGEYEQYHDFWFDFNNILFRDMYLKVSSLPKFGEILSYRSRFMQGKKMNKEERKYAQSILNEDILYYMDQQKDDIKSREVELTQITSNIFKEMQEKNRKGGYD